MRYYHKVMFLSVFITLFCFAFTQKTFAQDANANANASSSVTTGSVANSSTTTVTQGGASASVGVGGQISEQNLNQTFEAGNAPKIPDPAITIIPPNSPLPQIGFPLPIYAPIKGDPNVPAKDAAEGFTQILSLPHLKGGFTREDARLVVSQFEKKEGFFRVKWRIPAVHIVYQKNLPLSEPGEEVKYPLDVVPDLSQWETGMLVGMGEAEEFIPMDVLSMKAFLEIPKEYCVTHLLFLSGGILYTRSASEAKGLVLGGGTVGGATPGAHVITGVLGWGEIEGSTHSRNKSRVRAYAYCLRGQKQNPAPMVNREKELQEELEVARAQQKLLEEELSGNRQKLEETDEELAKRNFLEFTPPPPGIEFEFGSDKLRPGQEGALAAWVDWYGANQAAIQSAQGELTAVGFADECGGERINYLVAAKRAKALAGLVSQALADRGIESTEIKTLSAGKDWPFVSTAGFSCKEKKNRRAVLVFVGPHGIHGAAQ